MQLVNNADGGVEDATVTALNSGGASGDAFDTVVGTPNITFDDEHAYGPRAYKVAVSGATTPHQVVWTSSSVGTVGEMWGRLYLWSAAHPADNRLGLVRFLSGGSQAARLIYQTDGTLLVSDAGNGPEITTTGTVPTGQWCRIEWHITFVATSATIEVRLYNSADSATATETISTTTANGVGVNCDRVEIGAYLNGLPSTWTGWIDNIEVNDSDWPGPATEEHSGSATISGALGMGASGAPAVDGSATLAGVLAVTGGGSPSVGGSGTLGGLLTLSASGTADTGIGLPPRPRVRWQLVAGPASGGHTRGLTTATNRRYVAKLTDASELSFVQDGRHPESEFVQELTTDVHVLWTDSSGQTRILDRLRVGDTQRDITEDSHTKQVTCLDYTEVLNRRILWDGATLTFESEDQAEIAWALIEYTQSLDGGQLGIAKGWTGTTPTGVTRDRTYELGDSIGERIQELSEVIDGFDWDVLPTSASALALRVWYPQRGTDRGVVLEYGGLVASAQRAVTTGDYANAVRYTGAPGTEEEPGPDPVEEIASGIADRDEGRWDKAFGDDGLITQSALDDRAAWQLGQSMVVPVVWTVRLKRGGWRGPDHIWLGDPVRLIVRDGDLVTDQTYRVYEVQIDLDGDGGETVTLALGGPRPDFRKRATETQKRLRNLERR